MTIVLIPGLMNDGWVWSRQIGALSRLGPVSIACNDGLDSLNAMGRRILDTTQGPLSVIGHSMGGRIALEMFADAPDRIARLVLLDTGAHGARPGETAARQTLVELAKSRGMGAVAEAWLPDMLGTAARGDADLREQIVAMLGRCSPETFARQQRALLQRQDRTDLLSRITCPTLICTGAEDGWATPAQHRQMADAIEGARFAVVATAGHMLPAEAPNALSAILIDFLESDGSQRIDAQ